MKDEFLRLFLFNNTIFKLRLNENDPTLNVTEANNLLYNITNWFQGTIEHSISPHQILFEKKLTNLSTLFKFVNFKDKLSLVAVHGIPE